MSLEVVEGGLSVLIILFLNARFLSHAGARVVWFGGCMRTDALGVNYYLSCAGQGRHIHSPCNFLSHAYH